MAIESKKGMNDVIRTLVGKTPDEAGQMIELMASFGLDITGAIQRAGKPIGAGMEQGMGQPQSPVNPPETPPIEEGV